MTWLDKSGAVNTSGVTAQLKAVKLKSEITRLRNLAKLADSPQSRRALEVKILNHMVDLEKLNIKAADSLDQNHLKVEAENRRDVLKARLNAGWVQAAKSRGLPPQGNKSTP